MAGFIKAALAGFLAVALSAAFFPSCRAEEEFPWHTAAEAEAARAAIEMARLSENYMSADL